MEQKGLVSEASRGRSGGRTITPLGMEELKKIGVINRLGFTAAKVDSFAWRMNFDLKNRKGDIVLNVSMIDEYRLKPAIEEMIPVFKAGFGMGEFVVVARAGERLGDALIPSGKVGIGTICGVTVNGILLKAGIPMISRFGGVLEVKQKQPSRFTDVIYYDGTSLDPLEIFIKAGLTSVRKAVRSDEGRIGVSFREVPTDALSEVEAIRKRLTQTGLQGILTIGKPNQSLIEFPVHEGRTGILVCGGLNPISAIEESGISTQNNALSTLFPFEEMYHYRNLETRFRK